MSFWTTALPPLFEIEPFTVVPPFPVFQIFNVSLFIMLPAVAIFNALPWFVRFNLPSVLEIVPRTLKSPLWFVIIALPVFSTIPLTESPSSPVFKTVKVSLLVILPVVPILKPVPLLVICNLPF